MKRKRNIQQTVPVPINNTDFRNSESNINLNTSSMKNYGGPSRFDLPEVDELTLGVFSSFDDITYNTQPIVQAPERMSSNDKIFRTLLSVPSNADQCNELSLSKKYDIKSENSDDDWSQSCFSEIKEVPDSCKKVRFDPNNKENFKKSEHFSHYGQNSIQVVDNHAKIIREVLKKYPHLVKHSKNIRLKIMQKETKSTECSTPVTTKISYVVLKSDFLMTNESDGVDKKNFISSTLDNDERGPWKCSKCNLDEEYTNYFMYRRHMQDVHNEKFDPRICEHCGYRATKRNILMYHMYTKHNITPPKSISFPRCKICSYVGLSESLLARHQANHKNQSANLSQPLHLNLHSKSTLESDEEEKNYVDTHSVYHEEKNYVGDSTFVQNKCSACGKHFNNLSNLNFHFKSLHQDTLACKSIILEPMLSEVATTEASDYEISCNKVVAKIECHTTAPTTSKNNIQNSTEPSDTIPRTNISIHSGTLSHIQLNKEYCSSEGSSLPGDENFEEQDEILTEVVEEFQEATEVMKNQQICRMPTIILSPGSRRSMSNVENNTDIDEVNTEKIENVIQYVEEETEIVEYETHASL